MSLCQCGCGQKAPISTTNNKSKRAIKGQPRRYCKGHNPKHKEPLRRFFEHLKFIPGRTCWVWDGCSSSGYGTLQINRKAVYAHRFSYAQFNGPIPDGMLVCHSCDCRDCVSPEHLFLGDDATNTQDCIRKGRAWWQNYSSPREESILSILRRLKKPQPPRMIGKLIDMPATQVGQTLRVLLRKGLVCWNERNSTYLIKEELRDGTD